MSHGSRRKSIDKTNSGYVTVRTYRTNANPAYSCGTYLMAHMLPCRKLWTLFLTAVIGPGYKVANPLAYGNRAALPSRTAFCQINLLLARDDVDPDLKDITGRTPLSLAASNGHEAIVNLLLTRDDVDPDLKNNSGCTPLSLAASNGREAIVKLLLARDNVNPTSQDKDGQTPLLLPASNGHEAIVNLLLARDDIDLDLETNSGHTPLSLAVSNGREAVVNLLQ